MPRLQVQLEKTAYTPGETVRAWARAIDGGDSRAGMALLRYMERTDDYEEVAWHKMERLWNGDITAGQAFECQFELPADAKPGYSTANGSLTWEVFIRSDEFGSDSTTIQPFELVPPPGGFAPPPPPSGSADASGLGWVKPLYYATPAVGGGIGYVIARIPGAVAGVVVTSWGAVMDWRRRARHFEVQPQRPVRRGESARVAVRMIDAAKVTGELEAELECVEEYDYLSNTGRSPSRKTKVETLHVERVPLGASQRSADIPVPAELPFSHWGSCLSYRWTIRVREKRDNAMDRIAEQPLDVLP